jgi:glycosyltransferase involved in cell wall biosynthesis
VPFDSSFPSSATPPPTLSVILCTLNGGATIRAQLEALSNQLTDRQFEVVVVDNGSTDETSEVVRTFIELDGRIRIVPAHERQNLSYARNVGVERATASAVAFCDDDDVVGQGWIEAMTEALEHAPVVGSRLEYLRLNPADRLVGRARFQSERIGEMFGLPVLSGAGFGCQRWLWDLVGGIDEDFGTTGEDFDFSMRIFETNGVEPLLVESAAYHYRLRSGARGTFRQARRYGASHAQLYARHGRGRADGKANTLDAMRDWWWIATRAPLAALGQRRENWATHAGRRLGRLIGSIKYRVIWL